jgi:hypothetical protein
MTERCVQHGVWIRFLWLGLVLVAVGCQQAPSTPANPPKGREGESKYATVAQPTPSAATPSPSTANDLGPSLGPATNSGEKESTPAGTQPQQPSSTEGEKAASAPSPGPSATAAGAADAMPAADQAGGDEEPKPVDLGPPLVDDPKALTQLQPDAPVWVDKQKHAVVLQAIVTQREVPLELFACLKGSKEHESVVAVPAKAQAIHAALLSVGAEAGNPVQFQPDYVPAKGSVIEIVAYWRDAKGQVQHAPAQQWVRGLRDKKVLEQPWVFGGSQFVKDEDTKKEYYRADMDGDLICVSNFPSAMLDLPVKSSDSNDDLSFECYTEHIPPRGTPVTLVLTPQKKK